MSPKRQLRRSGTYRAGPPTPRLRRAVRDRRAQRAAGLGRRSRIATAVPNGPEAATSAFAIAAAATRVPLNPALRVDEARPAHDVRRWASVARAEPANSCGPTEKTIAATFERCPREDVPATIPIGRRMSNTRTLVLDPRGAAGRRRDRDPARGAVVRGARLRRGRARRRVLRAGRPLAARAATARARGAPLRSAASSSTRSRAS